MATPIKTMSFKDYWTPLTPAQKDDLAARCHTSRARLANIASGSDTCGAPTAIDIERETAGVVRVESLSPNTDWQYIRGTAKPTAQRKAKKELNLKAARA